VSEGKGKNALTPISRKLWRNMAPQRF